MTIYLVMEQFHKTMEPIFSSSEIYLTQEEAELEVDRLLKYWYKQSEYSAWCCKFDKVEK